MLARTLLVFALAYMFICSFPSWAIELMSVPEEEIEEIEEVVELEEVDTNEGFWSANRPQVDRMINMYRAGPIRAKSVLFSIDHRTNQALIDSDANDYLGFDAGGLKIGLGLRYGVMDDLDVGFFRLNQTVEIFDTYEVDVRYRFLHQQEHMVDLAIRAGLSWFAQPDQDDEVGFFGQLLVDRLFADQLLLGAGLLFHSESTNDAKTTQDEAYSMAVQAMAEWRFLPNLSWSFELAAGIAGYSAKRPVFATSIKLLTHRHTFSLIFTNNQYLGADGVVSNSWRDLDDAVIGFQITREINF